MILTIEKIKSEILEGKLNESEFIEGNVTLTEKIAQTLREGHKLTPIILSSSIQADRDNAYGKSKLGGEQALEKLHAEQGNPVYICRLANVFGKWSRPNYNSAVATICHNVANDLPLQINDANALIRKIRKMQDDIKKNIEHDNNWKKFQENFDLVYENYLKRKIAW